MAAPMFYTNRVAGVLIMHKANVEDLTLSYSNMFEITTSLANQAFNKAYAYHNAQEDELYIDGTEILKPIPFKGKLHIVDEQIKDGKATAALLDIGTRQSKKYFEKVRALVRDVDYVGVGENGRVMILLSGIKREDVPIVQNRLKTNGIESRVLEISNMAK